MRFRYVLFLLFFIVACGKDEAIVPAHLVKNNGNDTTGTSSPDPTPSTPTAPAPNLSDTYQPLTNGSNWKYAEIDEFNDTAWVTTTLTGKTITEGGKQFYEADNKYEGFGNDGITYFHIAGDIYTYRSEEGFSDGYQNFEYLRSALATNAKWEVSLGKNPITTFNERLLGTIKQKGIKHTVMGKEYQNVVQTELILQNEIMGFWIPITTLKFYIAKGIGIVEKEVSFGEGPTAIVTKQYLKSYSIAK